MAVQLLLSMSLVLVLASALGGIARAETWPTRPIKFVVPFGPGIGIDIMARTVGDRVAHKLDTPVIIENIPGAGNILGAQAVARATPDGYTFLFTGPSPVVTNIYLFKSLPYDPYRDFSSVAMIADRGPWVIVSNPEMPFKTLPEFLDYVRARPGQLHCAIDGSAIFQSVVARYFAKKAGIEMVEVGYRSTSQALQDTVSGVTQVAFASVAASAALVDGGKLRRIAITSKTRFPGLEDLPTISETVANFSIEGYILLLAPAGLPSGIAQRMNRTIDEILKEPEILKRFQAFGYATSGARTPAAVDEHIRADREQWATFARELSLEPR
ncbi:MAG: Bug family tripartite tricarboxylate transporter substrate binding protein [Xanthobacteraceae bacterium]